MIQQDDKKTDNKRERMQLNFEASVFEANFRSQEKKKQSLAVELSMAKKKRDLLDASIKSLGGEIKRLESEMTVNQEEAKKIRRKINMLTD